MKKKVIALILSMVAMTSVVSCYGKEVKARDEEMFVVVQDNWEYDIVYDKETKVMYTYSKGGDGYRTNYDNRGILLCWLIKTENQSYGMESRDILKK